MTHDEALALYSAEPKVVAKILCDLSNTIESQQEQVKALDVKVPIYDRSDLDGFYLAVGTSGNQYKNGPVAGKIMAEIIEACENGHDHDSEPVSVPLHYIDFSLNTGTFSRNREIIRDSSFSVLG